MKEKVRRKETVWQTVQLANEALFKAKESLWINLALPNKWEIVVLDREGGTTRHKLKTELTNNQIIRWINNWTEEYEIMLLYKNGHDLIS